MSERLKVLSLFCGCGGLDTGFIKNSAFNVMKSYDLMKYAIDVYNLNYERYGHKAEILDVCQLKETPDMIGFYPDVIIGGPPCQDFSAAGLQKIGRRANLTTTYVDLVCHYRPRFFVMENVPTIRSIGKIIYNAITTKLKEEGYGITTQVVYMPDYGIPQIRKRLIMIGVLHSGDDCMETLLKERKDPIRSIREYADKEGIDLGLGNYKHIYRHPRTYDRRGVFSVNELYPTIRGVLRKMPPTYVFHEGDTAKNRVDVMNPDWKFIARVQTFAEDFQFSNKNNTIIIGNAVPPKFSCILADVIATYNFNNPT